LRAAAGQWVSPRLVERLPSWWSPANVRRTSPIRRTLDVQRTYVKTRVPRGMHTSVTRRSRTRRRVPLSRQRVLRTAIKLADEGGIESLSMRNVAQELGV